MAKHNILFVCLGNICRSPMAEGVFRHCVEQAGEGDDYRIASAGTGAWHVGQPPDGRAQAALRARGIDISAQRARQIAGDDFARFDLVLAMDNANRRSLLGLAPEAQAQKVRLFLDFAPGAAAVEVPDPYFGGAGGFARALALIEAAAQGLHAALGKADRSREYEQ